MPLRRAPGHPADASFPDASGLERVPQKWHRFCDKNALKGLNREHDSTIGFSPDRIVL